MRRAGCLALGLALALWALPWSTFAASSPTATATGGVQPDPLVAALNLSAHRTKVGDRLNATSSVTNLGVNPLNSVTATIRVPTGIVVTPSLTQSLGTIAGGKTATATWQLCARQPGNYVIAVDVSARATDGARFAITSPAQVLNVVSSPRTCKT